MGFRGLVLGFWGLRLSGWGVSGSEFRVRVELLA